MTFHTSTSTSRPARLAAIGLMALGLLLSGCSAGAATAPSPTATPTPTPPAEPKEIAAEIAAAFPTEAEWLETYETGRWCTAEIAGPTNCGYDMAMPGTLSNGFTLRDDATGVTAAAVAMQVLEHGSAEAAQAELAENKAADVVFTGDFDIPENDETNSAGQRGTGTLVDFVRDDWVGYRVSQVAAPTGSEGIPFEDETATNSIVLANGPLTLVLRVYYASTEPGVADAEVDGWLDRVLGPEETD